MPEENKRVTLYLPAPLIEALDKAAKAETRNRSQQAEVILRAALDVKEAGGE